MADYYAVDHGLPCRNPNCHSHGKPHPNCKCYGGGGAGDYAKGGCVSMEPHKPGCEYYMAQGGEVPPQPLPQFQDNPSQTIGHAAAHHGLLGVLQGIGKAKMAEPEKHVKVLESARDQHMLRHSGPTGFEAPKKTIGVRLGNHIADGKFDDASEMMAGHPLVGSVGKTNLKPIMERMAQPMMLQEPHPQAFRGAVDYLSGSMKGQEKLNGYMDHIFGLKKSEEIKQSPKEREALKAYLAQIRDNPNELLEAGGQIGHYLPNHGAQIGALAATATQYLENFRPKQAQNSPLDEPTPIDKMQESHYNRQLDIAQNPILVLQHVKDGTLQPTDLLTLGTLYPGLHDSIVAKAGERLIEAKAKNIHIPYKEKQSLSLLLGQPLDSTMTPQAMQAIMRAQGPQQAELQSKKPQSKSKATDVELKQINKVDALSATPLEARQIDKKE